jgi:hypothetical protein
MKVFEEQSMRLEVGQKAEDFPVGNKLSLSNLSIEVAVTFKDFAVPTFPFDV